MGKSELTKVPSDIMEFNYVAKLVKLLRLIFEIRLLSSLKEVYDSAFWPYSSGFETLGGM